MYNKHVRNGAAAIVILHLANIRAQFDETSMNLPTLLTPPLYTIPAVITPTERQSTSPHTRICGS